MDHLAVYKAHQTLDPVEEMRVVLEGNCEDEGYPDFVVELTPPTMTLNGTVTLSQ